MRFAPRPPPILQNFRSETLSMCSIFPPILPVRSSIPSCRSGSHGCPFACGPHIFCGGWRGSCGGAQRAPAFKRCGPSKLILRLLSLCGGRNSGWAGYDWPRRGQTKVAQDGRCPLPELREGTGQREFWVADRKRISAQAGRTKRTPAPGAVPSPLGTRDRTSQTQVHAISAPQVPPTPRRPCPGGREPSSPRRCAARWWRGGLFARIDRACR